MIFLQKISKFYKIIQILKNNIVYILLYSFSNIHKDFFKENSNIIKNALIQCINNLDDKEIQNLNDYIENNQKNEKIVQKL